MRLLATQLLPPLAGLWHSSTIKSRWKYNDSQSFDGWGCLLHGLPSGVNVRPARLLQSRGGESGGGEIKGRIGGGGVAIGDGGTCGDRTDGVGCDEHDLMEILSRGGRFVSTHRLSHSAESTHHCMVQNEKYWHNGSSSHRPWHSASLAAPALLNGSPPQCLRPSDGTG